MKCPSVGLDEMSICGVRFHEGDRSGSDVSLEQSVV